MPLIVRTRPDTGALEIYGTVTPAGSRQGVRVRRRAGSDNHGLAWEEAAALEAGILRDYHHGKPAQAVVHTLGEAAKSYLAHEPRSDGTLGLVRRMLLHFGDAPLPSLTQEAIDIARTSMLRPGAAPGTVRRNLIVPLRAILLHAARRGWCSPPMFDLPAEPRGRTAFLLPEQAARLIAHGAKHLRPLLITGFGTGCRLSELLGMDWDDVDLAACRALLWEGETKSGRRRVVHLPPAVGVALAALPGRSGAVFLSTRHAAYREAGSGRGGGHIKTAWRYAMGQAGLSGFTPHHMRHSWATWHYAVHRDLLRLKSDGGWSSVALVERYAHIMPQGHENAVRGVWGTAHVGGTEQSAPEVMTMKSVA